MERSRAKMIRIGYVFALLRPAASRASLMIHVPSSTPVCGNPSGFDMYWNCRSSDEVSE